MLSAVSHKFMLAQAAANCPCFAIFLYLGDVYSVLDLRQDAEGAMVQHREISSCSHRSIDVISPASKHAMIGLLISAEPRKKSLAILIDEPHLHHQLRASMATAIHRI